MLPQLSTLSPNGPGLSGFRLEQRDEMLERLREEIGEWVSRLGESLEHLGRRIEGDQSPEDSGNKRLAEQHERRLGHLARIDHSHILLAEAGSHPAKVSGVHIPPGGAVTAVFALTPPPESESNDRYRLDVIQHHGQRILGGSSYVIASV